MGMMQYRKTIDKYIGIKLKHYRRESNVTTATLSNTLGISRSTYISYENGNSSIPANTIVILQHLIPEWVDIVPPADVVAKIFKGETVSIDLTVKIK